MIDGTALALNLTNRASTREADLFTSVVTVQEITAGWLAEINRRRAGAGQLNAYQHFNTT